MVRYYHFLWKAGFILLIGFVCSSFLMIDSQTRKDVVKAETNSVASSFRFPIDDGQYRFISTAMYGRHVNRDDRSPCYDTAWRNLNHAGVDFFTTEGTSVYAVADGTVALLHIGSYPGGAILIQHQLPDGTIIYSSYGHLTQMALNASELDNYLVSMGQKVEKGTKLGTVRPYPGNTPHLHFEIRQLQLVNDCPGNDIGSGYTAPDVDPDSKGYLDPVKFINDFNFYSQMNTSQGAAVFTDSFFRGAILGYLQPGLHNLSGPFDNAISSIALGSGLTAHGYDNKDGNANWGHTYFDTIAASLYYHQMNSPQSSSSADNRISSLLVMPGNCSQLTSASINASASACDPNPAPQPGPNPEPAPPGQPDPSDFTGISFFRDKNYGGFIRELGYGEHQFSDDFLSVRMENTNMHFTVYDQGGGKDCFDANRFGGSNQYPSFNDHGDWWHKTVRVKIEYGACSQGTPPTRWVVFFREKNFVNRFTEKPIGWEGQFTDDFQSVKLDQGVSFVAVDERNEVRCFDLWDFGGRQEASSFNDHGDWWHNIKWLKVQGNLCPPHDVQLNYPQQGAKLDFNTDITLDLNIPANTISVYGELWGLAEPWFWNQPATNRYWHIGVLPPGGPYTVRLRAANDNGFGNWTDFRFTVAAPSDCNSITTEGVVLFDGFHCSSEQIALTVPGWYSLEQFNERTSSIYVKPGWSIEVMENSSTSDGKATCITDTKWNLSYDPYWPTQQAIEGTISTVRVFNAQNCGRTQPIIGCDAIQLDGVGLFDYTNCLGDERLYTTPGFYNLTDFNDLASSLYIKPGWSVRVYQEHTKGGAFACFTEAKWDLSYDSYWFTNSKAHDDITSIEVFHDALCGWPQVPTLYDPVYEITDQMDFALEWENIYAGSYWVELWGPNGFFRTSGPVTQPTWHIGPLPVGEYIWKVRGEVLGQLNAWSAEHRFTVVATTPPTEPDCRTVTATGVQLFTERFCQGSASQEFALGSYELNPEYNGSTINFNNLAQSVYIPVGMSIKVYEQSSKQGLVSCYGETMWDLSVDKYWASEMLVGNTISSLEVFADPHCGVPQNPQPPANCTSITIDGIAVFSDTNCQGEQWAFTSPGYYTLIGLLHDTVSALYVAPGWSLEVYENTSPQDGKALCVSGTLSDLSHEAYYDSPGFMLDNSISTLRVHHTPNCGKQFPLYGGCGENIAFAGVVLFDYKDCSGSEAALDKPGKYDLFPWGMHDAISSIHVEPGWSIKVYQDEQQIGLTSCYATDMWNLGADKYWNSEVSVGNSISSIEVFNDSRCGVLQEQPKTLTAPTNLTPINSALSISNTVTLLWTGLTEPTLYEVEVVQGPVTVTPTQVTGTAFHLPEVKVGLYDWRVRAIPPDVSTLPSEWTRGQFAVLEETVTLPVGNINIFLPIVNR